MEEFVATAFDVYGLDWRDYVRTDAKLLRPSEIHCGFGDASKAAAKLGWKARTSMPELVKRMVTIEASVLVATTVGSKRC